VSAAGSPQTTSPVVRPVVRKARLFFMTVDPAGRLLMKSVIRPIPASDSPLRDTLEALLKGPTAQEMNSGMLSMIPTEARLRAVTVSGETAVVDFNESFRFNAQGIEALNAQLRQVVYAATEFPSVKEVQVLIEGRKVRSLGTEGVRIDTPLSRSSFPQ
jgi:spore germination protein GerM